MKLKVLYEGETGVLINRNGEIKTINGPKRVKKKVYYLFTFFFVEDVLKVLINLVGIIKKEK